MPKGKYHHNWKGGTSITPWGYRRYNPTYAVHGGRFEHVVVMEQKLGRKINSKIEKVHHVNGDKLDNRPENLQLLDIKTHNHIHRPDLKNIRHPVYGYYIKKTLDIAEYAPHHLKRKRNKLGRFL